MMYVLSVIFLCYMFFFFKQKTAYEMRISDWSSDVCSSDLTFATKRHFLALPYNIRSESPATRVVRPKGAPPLTRTELFIWRPPDFGLVGAVFFWECGP